MNTSPLQHMPWPPQASLLGLPTELRLRIYDFVFAGDPLTVSLYGTANGAEERIKHVSQALRLKRVCRLFHCESYSTRPSIAKINFYISDCTTEDVEDWLSDIGVKSAAGIRRLKLETWAGCFGDFYRKDGHMAWCNVRNGGLCNFGCTVKTDKQCVIKSRRGLCKRAVDFDLDRAYREISQDAELHDWASWRVEDQLVTLVEREYIKIQLCGHEFITSDVCRAECGQGVHEVLRLIVRNARGGEIRLSKPDLSRLFELLSRSKKSRRESQRRSLWDIATEAAIAMVENTIVGG